jgi:hypothetical protein
MVASLSLLTRERRLFRVNIRVIESSNAVSRNQYSDCEQSPATSDGPPFFKRRDARASRLNPSTLLQRRTRVDLTQNPSCVW